MRLAITGLTFMAALGLAACANNPNRPTDTGNMAYPTPAASGTRTEAAPTGFGTGSVAQPTPSGNTGLRASPETLGNQGSMQLPQSSQGNLRRQ